MASCAAATAHGYRYRGSGNHRDVGCEESDNLQIAVCLMETTCSTGSRSPRHRQPKASLHKGGGGRPRPPTYRKKTTVVRASSGTRMPQDQAM
ncbi:hypothetical protein J2850_003721 [Azospirillum picis]|uniref:Uncharacterized protein n=1 Tax=Azospirillum picis TaxID=488438 RepID=A0ABU0MMI2_9PROT|nr:hypothetical protein [Azospirillum picis]MDQ0534376.1 hypothetical protein [Azospirillum picis]